MFLVPDFKGIDFFPHDTRLPFMRYKALCFGLSLLFMALSLGLIATKGFNFGVDFKGGSLIEVQSKSGPAPTPPGGSPTPFAKGPPPPAPGTAPPKKKEDEKRPPG